MQAELPAPSTPTWMRWSVNGQSVVPAGGQEFSPLVASCFSLTAAR